MKRTNTVTITLEEYTRLKQQETMLQTILNAQYNTDNVVRSVKTMLNMDTSAYYIEGEISK